MSRAFSYIVAAKRSPIGHLLGGLSKLKATEIGGQVLKAMLVESKIAPAAIDDVFIGQVLQAGCGQNPARQVALGGGLPDTISATTVNKVCGSGMQSAMFADVAIRAGEAQLVIAGGVESMSNAPHLIRNYRSGFKFGNAELVDVMLYDGLTNVYDNGVMGVIAEETAAKAGATRRQQDELAVQSHQRAAAAAKAGFFAPHIVPITVPKTDQPFSADETIRTDASLEKLGALRPAFGKDGTITPGNASTISDGAALLIVASETAVNRHNLTPLARIVAQTTSGGAPRDLFLAPIAAMNAVCDKAGWDRKSVDAWELNEAFAAQMCACLKGLEMTMDKMNLWGGAIALGHPIGASGGRLLGQLACILKQRGGKRGVASACLGGGNAVAMAIETV